MEQVVRVSEVFYLGLAAVVTAWSGLLGILNFFTNWRRWKLRLHHTALLTLAITLAAGATAFWRGVELAMPLDAIVHGLPRTLTDSPEATMQALRSLLAVPCTVLFAFVALPFLIHLYLKWTGRLLTGPERAGGVEGIRAWLSPRHVSWVILMALFGWLGLAYSFWLLLLGGFGALLLFPAITLGGPMSPQPLRAGARDAQLGEERRRVLTMLQEGKISVEESAELLYALGELAPSRSGLPPGAARSRTMLAVGAFIVLVGFFLPWFSFELNAIMPDTLPVPLRQTWEQFQGNMLENTNHTFTYSGPDIRNGLGWTILLLAAGAAALPFLSIPADVKARRGIMLALLAAGIALMAFLVYDSIRYASYGLLIVVIGYVFTFIGTVWEFRQNQKREADVLASSTS